MQTLTADEPHGHFDRDLAPKVSVGPGEAVRLSTLASGWKSAPGGARHPLWTPDAGHALTGPVEVRGARAGQTLSVRVDAVVPASWGTTYAGRRDNAYTRAYGLEGAEAVHRWDLDPVAGTGRNQHGHTVALRPFLGVIGMPPPEPGRHSTIPPRRWGGNLDCRELVAGSTLFLPVPVDGALLSAGDGHAAQGDGEVSGTAIECGMDRVELTLDVLDEETTAPYARTPAGWLTLGLGATLDEAAYAALNGMFDLLGRLHGLARADAVALASVAVDLRVTQLVNETVGAHALLSDGAIR